MDCLPLINGHDCNLTLETVFAAIGAAPRIRHTQQRLKSLGGCDAKPYRRHRIGAV